MLFVYLDSTLKHMGHLAIPKIIDVKRNRCSRDYILRLDKEFSRETKILKLKSLLNIGKKITRNHIILLLDWNI